MVLHYEAPASDHEIHDDLFFTLPLPIRALVANVTMLITTTVFELACWQEVKKFYAKNPKLYLSAWWTNVVTISIVNVAMYIVVATYLVDKTPNTMYQRALKFVGIILTHNVWYYHAHRAFHEVKGLYWMHSYHHKFNNIVLPSSANAVSIWEYSIAYVFPFLLAGWMLKPDQITMLLTLKSLHLANLNIHFPLTLKKKLPWFLVSSSDHKRHHIKLKTDYGAPILFTDRILYSLFGVMGGNPPHEE